MTQKNRTSFMNDPLGNVARIKLALRNQGRLAPFACYLVFKIGNFAVDVAEII